MSVAVAEKIRDVVLDPKHTKSMKKQVLLYIASRRQLVGGTYFTCFRSWVIVAGGSLY